MVAISIFPIFQMNKLSMTYLKYLKGIFIILITLTNFYCREKKDILNISHKEFNFRNILKTQEVRNAKYSPSGNKILIITEDFINFFTKPDRKFIHFYISDNLESSKIKKLFSVSDRRFKCSGTPCWLNDNTIIFGLFEVNKDGLLGNPKIYKYDIYNRNYSIVYQEENNFYIRDVLDNKILFTKNPEGVSFIESSPFPCGVMSLYILSLNNNKKPKRISSLHPDTTLPLSMVSSARFLNQDSVVIEKCIRTHEDDMRLHFKNEEPLITRRFELLSLSKMESKILREFKDYNVVSGNIGFEVSPSGEWLIYSQMLSGFNHVHDRVKIFSLRDFEISRTLPLIVDSNTISNKDNFIWVEDWSPLSDEVIIIAVNVKTWRGKLHKVRLSDVLKE